MSINEIKAAFYEGAISIEVFYRLMEKYDKE